MFLAPLPPAGYGRVHGTPGVVRDHRRPPVPQPTQLGLGLVIQVHAQVHQREGPVVYHQQCGRVLPFRLPTGIASGLDRAHETLAQRQLGIGGLEGLEHRVHHLWAGQHVAGGDEALAHPVSAPGRIALARAGRGVAVHVHHGQLPMLGVRVASAELGDHFLGAQAPGDQVPGLLDQLRVGHGLHGGSAAAGHHQRAAGAHIGRVGGDAHAVLAAAAAMRDDGKGHADGSFTAA